MCAEQVAAGLYPDVLAVLGADLAQLERGAHLAVQLVLLLGHLQHNNRQIFFVTVKYFSSALRYFYLDMILGRGLDSPREVGVDAATVGVKVTGTEDTLTCDHHLYFSLCQINVDTYNPSLDPSSRA